jgi:DNA-directed RNA polymerase subunit M/transcription elongation factor TFIIS
MQEINNVMALLENLLLFQGLPDRLHEKIGEVISKTKVELTSLKEKCSNLHAKSEEELEKRLSMKMKELEELNSNKLELAIKEKHQEIEEQVRKKQRCPKCGDRKMSVRLDDKNDILVVVCKECGYKTNKDLMDPQ